MVSVTHSVLNQDDHPHFLDILAEGMSTEEALRLEDALDFAKEVYGETLLGSDEGIWSHAIGVALILAGLKLDADSRIAALLFAIPAYSPQGMQGISERFGPGVAQLVNGISRLHRMRPITRGFMAGTADRVGHSSQETRAQVEVLRKMLLSMVEDIRVVLLRLASRTQTLRYYAANPDPLREQVARETLELYSPLANRLGVWELKWELEDLSFRFLHPDTYKKIAGMLDQKRMEREAFIAEAIDRLKAELASLGIDTEVYGRPKHIYSIWNKMRKKGVEFSEVYDVRALRVIVEDVKDCYTALGVVHNIWVPIPKEFDDYISNPKGNNYRSLHTAVSCPDGRSLEVQIRTWDMHRHAELGVAAHWRYKEGSKNSAHDSYDEKIAWLRQLLTWKDEVADSSDWVRYYKQAALDETVYVMTPQGKVVDLPRGATALDFAYRVHTDLGHRCRGAKVDGVLVPLSTALKTGQRVEVIAAKVGGPSRDWLNTAQKYVQTKSARTKIRQWFASLALEQSLSEGRSIVLRELQRLGQTGASIEELAQKLGFAKGDDLFIAAARGDLNIRQFQNVVRATSQLLPEQQGSSLNLSSGVSTKQPKGILVVGVDKLLTQLARCCKPTPQDAIEGFVTRGKGVSIHRADCSNFQHLAGRHPERTIEATWGAATQGLFAVDVAVDAHDRQGLLRDISDVFTREKVNVIAVHTQSRQGKARMGFTIEILRLEQLRYLLGVLHDIEGVVAARRV